MRHHASRGSTTVTTGAALLGAVVRVPAKRPTDDLGGYHFSNNGGTFVLLYIRVILLLKLARLRRQLLRLDRAHWPDSSAAASRQNAPTKEQDNDDVTAS